jgi:hypothetical protein
MSNIDARVGGLVSTADTTGTLNIQTNSVNAISIDGNQQVKMYGQIGFQNSNGEVGYIATSGTTTTYNTSSDYRLKENIKPMTDALAKVSALKPVTYNWKIDGSTGQGFIAHDLQEVVPDCVTGKKDEMQTVNDVDAEGKVIGTKEVPMYQGVDTSFLVATLVSAMQELKAEVDELKAQIKTLFPAKSEGVK